MLILHLSDIHVHNSKDPILGRAAQIASAAQWGAGSTHCLLVLTGDIAFSGQGEQYEAASEWLSLLRDALRHKLPTLTKIDTLIVPGNHDLSHRSDDNIRRLVLDSLKKSDGTAPPPDVLNACVEPQKAFFASVARLGDRNAPEHPQLVWEQMISTDMGNVHFICLNSAWISQLREVQGTLQFPHTQIPAASDSPLTIALLHHPLNWFDAECGRALARALAPVADLVLTGHEHDGELVKTQRRDTANLFVAGDALQLHGNAGSGFGLFQIDMMSKRYMWRRLSWRRDRYEVIESQDTKELLPSLHRRTTRATQLTTSWERELADPGVILENSKGTLTLDDIYVEPFLRREDIIDGVVSRAELASNLLAKTDSQVNIVVGDERLGRSSLGKFLFRRAFAKGWSPVLIAAGEIRSTSSIRPSELFCAQFVKQFQGETPETFVQLEAERRITIIDDFDTLQRGVRHAILEYLESISSRVILLCRDTFGWDMVTRPGGTIAPCIYRLLPFRKSQREQLIRGWQVSGLFRLSGGKIAVQASMA